MTYTLKNGRQVNIRILQSDDTEKLFAYFNDLSAESRSRFGPHPFDRETTGQICSTPGNDIKRFIATDDASGNIIAYMLIKQGMIAGDISRYAQWNARYNYEETATFAPSVADSWQSSGLGSLMLEFIEGLLRKDGVRIVVLWGGVQAGNEKAVNYYRKHGYKYIASFWHDGKDNYDMIKEL